MNGSLDEIQKKGVLNETTNTVHKHKTGESDLQTDCGVSRHLTPDQLQSVAIDKAIDSTEIGKCGRCFSDGRGY